MDEIFKEVNGTDGKYMISNLGRLKSLCGKQPLFVRYFEDKDGYFKYGIFRKNKLIHRLVAIAFIDNPENKPEVNHKDGDKQNNRVDNLEWVTRSENAQHSFDNKLQVAIGGEKHYASKLTKAIVIKIRKSKGVTQKSLAEKYKVSQSVICDVIKGKTWKHIQY